jgi:hypothetical protein
MGSVAIDIDGETLLTALALAAAIVTSLELASSLRGGSPFPYSK